jgi:hypothetical protein
MHLGNLDLGSAIEGESTNGDAGRGGRKTAVLCDEFAAVPERAGSGRGDRRHHRLPNLQLHAQGRRHPVLRHLTHKRARILTLPWWRHPEKGRGAHQVARRTRTSRSGRARGTRPSPCVATSGRWLRKWTWTTPRPATRSSTTTKSRSTARAFERPPMPGATSGRGRDLGDDQPSGLIARGTTSRSRVVRGAGGSGAVDAPGRRAPAARPDLRFHRHRQRVQRVELGHHLRATKSGKSSAKFWSAHVSPRKNSPRSRPSRGVVGRPIGSRVHLWENNGPGGIFGRKLIKLGYQRVYFQRQDTQARAKDDPLGLALQPAAQGNPARALPRGAGAGQTDKPVPRIAR